MKLLYIHLPLLNFAVACTTACTTVLCILFVAQVYIHSTWLICIAVFPMDMLKQIQTAGQDKPKEIEVQHLKHRLQHCSTGQMNFCLPGEEQSDLHWLESSSKYSIFPKY